MALPPEEKVFNHRGCHQIFPSKPTDYLVSLKISSRAKKYLPESHNQRTCFSMQALGPNSRVPPQTPSTRIPVPYQLPPPGGARSE